MGSTIAQIDQRQRIFSRAEIISILNGYKVPWESWGTAAFEKLLADHQNGRVYICDNTPDKLIIDVHAAIVIVAYKHKRQWLEIYEDRQVFDGGRVLRRDNFDGIAETALRSEVTMDQTAVRCLEEELGFTDPSFYQISDCFEIENRPVAKSEKWQGIFAAYHRYKFRGTIKPQLFRPDGYIEKQEIKTVYFKWRKFEQHELPGLT